MLLLRVCNLVVKLFRGNQFSVSLKIFNLINIKMKLVFRVPPSYINFVLNLIGNCINDDRWHSIPANSKKCPIAKKFSIQFGPRSGPTECWPWSGFKLFGTMYSHSDPKRIFLKKLIFKKIHQTLHSKHEILPSLQRVSTLAAWLYSDAMRGSRKFCQRLFFLVDEGREDPSTTISGPSPARQQNAIQWRFAGVQMMAQHWMMAW